MGHRDDSVVDDSSKPCAKNNASHLRKRNTAKYLRLY